MFRTTVLTFWGLVWIVLFPFQTVAQIKDSTKAADRKIKTRIFAVPTLGSGPETGFYFGAVSLFDFFSKNDTLSRHSVAKAELTYTLKKQFVVGFDWTLTNSNRDWVLTGENSWLKFPELFWGIGGRQPGTNEVLYDANRLELANALYRKAKGKIYLGICQQFQRISKLDLINLSEDNKEIYGQLSSGISSGAGLGLLLDTRTNLLNPRPGEAFISIQSMRFGKIFGSKYSFTLTDLDARFYQKITGSSLMAYQIFGQLRTNGAPYRMLGLLGGPMILRGYYQGRYRDNLLLASQFEYRFKIHKWFGMTAFGGIGNVRNFENAKQNGTLKSAAGLGLRILVDPKENSYMRFDFALTRKNDFGFYVSFGEAF